MFIIVAVVLGAVLDIGITSAIDDSVKTDTATPASSSGSSSELVDVNGNQVEIMQSGVEVMLGMLPIIVAEDPALMIKVAPKFITIHDGPDGHTSLTIAKSRYNRGVLTLSAVSGEVIVVESPMRATLYRSQQAVADFTAWSRSGLTNGAASYSAPGDLLHFCAVRTMACRQAACQLLGRSCTKNTNANILCPPERTRSSPPSQGANVALCPDCHATGALCATQACVPVELKSMENSAGLRAAFVAFENATADQNCESINEDDVSCCICTQSSSLSRTPGRVFWCAL